MNTLEFSTEFDLLYNNISSNAAPGLTEYEKSVFLTQALEEIILSIYNGLFNGDSFEASEEVTRYIDNLVRLATITTPIKGEGVSEDSVFYKIPDDVWFPTLESVYFDDKRLGCMLNEGGYVKPVTLDEFNSISRDPFKSDNKRRVLRLTVADNVVELVSKYHIKSYFIRYLKRPKPIILANLTEYNTSINGILEVTECELNPVIHRNILMRAVLLAKAVWGAGN